MFRKNETPFLLAFFYFMVGGGSDPVLKKSFQLPQSETVHRNAYARNKSETSFTLNNHCNESNGIDPSCGTIEYLGCTGSKRFYHESAIKMNWFESWEYCRSVGLHLASIESRYEQTFVEIFLPPLGIPKTVGYWVSGTDLGKEGQFSWMATGRPLTFRNFRSGEPNNRFGSEHCLEMVITPGVIGYFWNDKNCLAKAYSLCQLDLRFTEKLLDGVPKNSLALFYCHETE